MTDAPKPWDVPWTFTVTWNPEQGHLPSAILRLFRHRSHIQPGQAVHQTDQGHATHYERAVRSYVQRSYPERTDITAIAAVRVDSPGEPQTAEER